MLVVKTFFINLIFWLSTRINHTRHTPVLKEIKIFLIDKARQFWKID